MTLPKPFYSAVFLLAFVGFYFTGNPIFANPDIGWHLASGDWILAHHALPHTDPWSFASAGTPWLHVEWLWDVLISAVYALHGPAGLYIFTCAFAALTLAVLAWCLEARKQVNEGYVLLMLALAWLAYHLILYPYPQLVTLLFAALSHRILNNQRREGILDMACVKRLVPLMILWANMHGGFLVAFIIMGAYLIEAYESRNFPWILAQVKLGAICAAACLVNPYHFHIINAVLQIIPSSITPYLGDWSPVTFGVELAVTLPLAFFILASNVRDPNIRLADKVLAFAWLLAGLNSRRNFPLFITLSAPYFAWCLQEFARAVQRQHFKPFDRLFPTDHTSAQRFLAFTVAVYAALAFTPLTRVFIHESLTTDDPFHIRPAMEYAEKHYPHTRFLNDYNLGGYLIYLSGGTWPVFIDGRVGLAYPEAVSKEAVDFNMGRASADNLFDKYHADGVIALRGHRYLPRLTGNWKKVFDNDTAVLYVRKE